MQAERFAPREVHRSVPQLTQALEKVSLQRETLRTFFQNLDESTFLENPTLQDLYGLFRLVDPDPALRFRPPEPHFLEHSPLCGVAPPFRAASSRGALEPGSGAAGATAVGNDRDDAAAADAADLHSLLVALKARLGPKQALALETRVKRIQSEEGVRELLLSMAREHHVVLPYAQSTIDLERSSEAMAREAVAREAAAKAKEDEARASEETLEAEGAPAASDTGSEEPEDEEDGGATDSDEAAHGTPKAQTDGETASAYSLAPRGRVAAYVARPAFGGDDKTRQETMKEADEELARLREAGPRKKYLDRRHRFVDPMFRRRRLKWIERQYAGANKDKEVKYNMYYVTHPDEQKEWPTNRGSTTVVWPSPNK